MIRSKYRYRIILIVVILIGLAVSLYVGMRLGNTGSESTDILKKVSSLIILPSEKPVIAEVTDTEKLQSELKDIAEKGDYVLVYGENQKVIVYRPSTNKIVEVMPLLFGVQPNANLSASVTIINGSTEEQTASFIRKLYTAYPNIRLVDKQTAQRTYPTTIVYSKNEDSTLPSAMSESLQIKSGIQPSDLSTDSDVTFVVGEDFKP